MEELEESVSFQESFEFLNKVLNKDSGQNKYVIETIEQAKIVAEFIKNHRANNCFEFVFGRHSLACGDGKRCHEEFLKIAQALADFVLDN